VTDERSDRTYNLEPLDTSGVFLGLGIFQCALLGAAITVAVLAITSGMPVPIAAVPLLVAAFATFARVGGHPVWEWIPLGIGWAWAGVRRGRRWVGALPLWPSADERAPLPPCLEALDIVDVDWRAGRELGAVRDGHRHTLTAIIPVTGPQFVVEPRAEQERLLAGWGDVLGQFAVERGIVTHLTWSDLARPSGMHQHRAWVDGGPRGEEHAAAADSYRELLRVATASAVSHDVALSITVARERLNRHRSGGDSADDQLARALTSSVDALLRGLRSAGLEAGDPLDARGIQRTLRERIDPVTPVATVHKGRLVERLALVHASTAGPLAMQTEWRHVQIDSALHRTWWIGTWPRLAQAPSWMEPFLSGGGITRTMTVVMVPVSTHQSRRRIERDLVKLESDAATKEDKGRRVDARHRRATQALLDREEELVAGYPEMAYAGLITVSARDLDELEAHGEVIEQLARESGMDLRLLDGRQDLAWAAALPLGLAPNHLLAS
jgi:hypothetical protein